MCLLEQAGARPKEAVPLNTRDENRFKSRCSLDSERPTLVACGDDSKENKHDGTGAGGATETHPDRKHTQGTTRGAQKTRRTLCGVGITYTPAFGL